MRKPTLDDDRRVSRVSVRPVRRRRTRRSAALPRITTNGQPIHICRRCGFVYVDTPPRRRADRRSLVDARFSAASTRPRFPRSRARLDLRGRVRRSSTSACAGSACARSAAGKGAFSSMIRGPRYGARVFGVEPSRRQRRAAARGRHPAFHGHRSKQISTAAEPPTRRPSTSSSMLWTLENCQDCKRDARRRAPHAEAGRRGRRSRPAAGMLVPVQETAAHLLQPAAGRHATPSASARTRCAACSPCRGSRPLHINRYHRSRRSVRDRPARRRGSSRPTRGRATTSRRLHLFRALARRHRDVLSSDPVDAEPVRICIPIEDGRGRHVHLPRDLHALARSARRRFTASARRMSFDVLFVNSWAVPYADVRARRSATQPSIRRGAAGRRLRLDYGSDCRRGSRAGARQSARGPDHLPERVFAPQHAREVPGDRPGRSGDLQPGRHRADSVRTVATSTCRLPGPRVAWRPGARTGEGHLADRRACRATSRACGSCSAAGSKGSRSRPNVIRLGHLDRDAMAAALRSCDAVPESVGERSLSRTSCSRRSRAACRCCIETAAACRSWSVTADAAIDPADASARRCSRSWRQRRRRWRRAPGGAPNTFAPDVIFPRYLEALSRASRRPVAVDIGGDAAVRRRWLSGAAANWRPTIGI